MKRRFIALVLTGVVGGSTLIGGAVFAASTSGQANGDCKMGYYTSTDAVYGGTVAQLSMNKSCAGPVEGRFTTNIVRYYYSRPSGSVHSTNIEMRATCTATGGFASPCTVGQVVTASPGSTQLSTCNTATEACPLEAGARGMNMVWPSLNRGVWSFEVVATANGGDLVRQRTFTVEAFTA